MLLSEDAEVQPLHAVQSSPALPCGLQRKPTHYKQRSEALAAPHVARGVLEQPQMHLAVNGVSARDHDMQHSLRQPLVVQPPQQTQQMQPAQQDSIRVLPHQATPQLADWQGQGHRHHFERQQQWHTHAGFGALGQKPSTSTSAGAAGLAATLHLCSHS